MTGLKIALLRLAFTCWLLHTNSHKYSPSDETFSVSLQDDSIRGGIRHMQQVMYDSMTDVHAVSYTVDHTSIFFSRLRSVPPPGSSWAPGKSPITSD